MAVWTMPWRFTTSSKEFRHETGMHWPRRGVGRHCVHGANRRCELVVRMDCQFENGQKVLYLTDAVEVASTSLQRPHGLCWISNSIIAVASREGNVSLFDIPPADRLTALHTLEPLSVIGKQETELLSTPGSLCARDLGAGLHELWVCNGFSHYVTHHLLNAAAGFSHLDAQLLMQHGLEVPDGVALDLNA